MKAPEKLFCIVYVLIIEIVVSNGDQDRNVDPASRQLFGAKQQCPKPNLLTTSAGKPVDIREVFNLNGDVLTNQYFLDTIENLVNERVPPRAVFAKGTGATGYFEVTNDITKYTKAKFSEKVGKKTPVFVRFSTSFISTGGRDLTTLTDRGFSIKLYTEEGNLDFINIAIPVYQYRDPTLFPEKTHAFITNPATNMRDLNQFFTFVTLNPEIIHSILWLGSEFGFPRGFRRMNSFPIHTYEIYNKDGKSYFVRFKFLSELGYESFNLQEAEELNALDYDFFVRDLFNAIADKDYPAWKMEMDVLNDDVKSVKFDPFDVTQLWPNNTYHTVPIGRLVLNRNLDNHFAQTEQSAFNPANLVPGILGPHDKVFKGRIIAYRGAHIARLGINANKIEVNRPRYACSYNRDGLPPVLDNGKGSVNYAPNSFNGPEPYVDEAKPNRRLLVRTRVAVDLQQSHRFYNSVLVTETQKDRLVDNLVSLSLRVIEPITKKFNDLLFKIDEDLGKRYARKLKIAKMTTLLPNIVEDIRKVEPQEEPKYDAY